MSDDLVKRLRSVDISWNEAGEYCAEAADLIEVLDKACKEWADVSQRNYQRAKAAEAKLAKAVKVLVLCRDMFDEVAHPSDPMSVLLNTTLAELEGDKA